MKSTVTFKQFFYENMTAGGADSAFGAPAAVYSPDNPVSDDTWNKDDTRIAKGSGVIQTRGGAIKKRKRKKKK